MSQNVHSAQDLLLVRSSHQVAQTLKRLHPETEEQIRRIENQIEEVGGRVVAAQSYSRASVSLRRLRRLCLKLDLMATSKKRFRKSR